MNRKCQAIWYTTVNPNYSGVGNLIVAGKRVNVRKEQEDARSHLFSEERREINESTLEYVVMQIQILLCRVW